MEQNPVIGVDSDVRAWLYGVWKRETEVHLIQLIEVDVQVCADVTLL